MTENSPEETLRSAVDGAALTVALAHPDPDSVVAATALRAQFPAPVAAAALQQASLRRRASTKFGDAAAGMFFTSAGLEQATRPQVADHRARRMAAHGITRVIDLGCGIGADAMAFVRAGLTVVAVEADPLTAEVARRNLAAELDRMPGDHTPDDRVLVRVGDAVEVAEEYCGSPGTAMFCDPARRNARGRTWDVRQFTPPWDFVAGLLAGPACLKLGPGVPAELIPDDVEACFVSHHGDLVEASVWSPTLTGHPGWVAELLRTDGVHRLRRGQQRMPVADRVPEPGDVIIEPDPAVLRAGATDDLAARLGAARVADRLGYLLADERNGASASDFGERFRVETVMAWKPKTLKTWLRDHAVGTLEIKKRGLELDPARLRRDLLGAKGYGRERATVIICPTVSGARMLVVTPLDRN